MRETISLARIERGYAYRLPTEADWEYACRAGTTTTFSFGDEVWNFGDHGWFTKNADYQTHVVGQKKPNPWGLYDMHGNVWEWCHDLYDRHPMSSDSVKSRVVRSGGFNYESKDCRSSSRKPFNPVDRIMNVGFRVVRIPASGKEQIEADRVK